MINWGSWACPDSFTLVDENSNPDAKQRCDGTIPRYKRKCCPSTQPSTSSWSFQNLFSSFTAGTRNLWNQLSETIKNKLASARSFATLTVSEIFGIDNDILSHVKTAAGMTTTQLSGIGGKIQSMSSDSELPDFLGNLPDSCLVPDAVSSMMEGGEAAGGWTQNQVTKIKDRVSQASAWGSDLSTWTEDQIAAIGKYLVDDASLFGRFKDTSLVGAVRKWGQETKEWSKQKALALFERLKQNDVWKSASNWNAEKVSALGRLIKWLPDTDLLSLQSEALVNATNLDKLTPTKITRLLYSTKFLGLSASNVSKLLEKLNAQYLFQSLISQCRFTCPNDSDAAFLENPSVSGAQAAVTTYYNESVARAKSVAKTFSDQMCDGSATAQIVESIAINTAQSSACTGNAKPVFGVATADEKKHASLWSHEQIQILLTRVEKADLFGSLQQISHLQLSSLCNQYAKLTPSGIAQMASTAAIEQITGGGGVQSKIVMFALSRASQNFRLQNQRNAWAQLLINGIGNVETWSCKQIASLGPLFSGFTNEQLKKVTGDAAKGITATAIQTMTASQISQLSPDILSKLSTEARNRISGDRLKELKGDSWKAVVCPSPVKCPHSVIDQTLYFDDEKVPSTADLKRMVEVSTSNAHKIDNIHVLSIVPSHLRPMIGNNLLMKNEKQTEVTMRIFVDEVPTTTAAPTSGGASGTSNTGASSNGSSSGGASVKTNNNSENHSANKEEFPIRQVGIGVFAFLSIILIGYLVSRCWKSGNSSEDFDWEKHYPGRGGPPRSHLGRSGSANGDFGVVIGQPVNMHNDRVRVLTTSAAPTAQSSGMTSF
eukprot:g5196.t1